LSKEYYEIILSHLLEIKHHQEDEPTSNPRDNRRQAIAPASAHGNTFIPSDNAPYEFIFQLPRWLTGAMWRIHMSKSLYCWSFDFRHYNPQYFEEDIFAVVGRGDIDKMLLLFRMNYASPFDCDAAGRSLLYVRSPQGALY